MKIKLYDKISKKGLKLFKDNYEINSELKNEDAILVRSTKLLNIEIDKNLKAIARAGAGVNNIPIDKCSEAGIVVFNTPGANANAVKELVIAGMLLSSRPFVEGINWVSSLNEKSDVAFIVEKEKSRFIGSELRGKKIGIIGLGAIGIKVANLAIHLGMEVYGYDPHLSVSSAWKLSSKVHYSKTLDELYEKCHFISVHVPLNDKTKNLINKQTVEKMRNDVCILNFSRDAIVNEKEICEALEEKLIKNYVSDFPNEITLNKKGVICIPHLGASTPESEDNCAIMAVNQIIDYLENGNIVNSVNLPDITLERSGISRICCFHKNAPNILANISQVISTNNLNIENMINKSKGEYAYTIVDVNKEVSNEIVDDLNKFEAMLRVIIL